MSYYSFDRIYTYYINHKVEKDELIYTVLVGKATIQANLVDWCRVNCEHPYGWFFTKVVYNSTMTTEAYMGFADKSEYMEFILICL